MSPKVVLAFLACAPAICHATAMACPQLFGDAEKLSGNDQWERRGEAAKGTPLDGFRINFGDPRVPDGAIYDRVISSKGIHGEELEFYIWDLKNIREPYAICEYKGTRAQFVKKVEGLSKCELVTMPTSADTPPKVVSARCY